MSSLITVYHQQHTIKKHSEEMVIKRICSPFARKESLSGGAAKTPRIDNTSNNNIEYCSSTKTTTTAITMPSLEDGPEYFLRDDDDGDTTITVGGSSKSKAWWKTKHGRIVLIGTGALLLLLVTVLCVKLFGDKHSYSFARECRSDTTVAVSMECGASIMGFDCDGTLDCQVTHNNIYCAKCSCNNNQNNEIEELFEDVPEECEGYL